jgi:hypothetical protein
MNEMPFNGCDDFTPLESPLEATENSYSPGGSMRMGRADSLVQETSSGETECVGNGKCGSLQTRCESCQNDKKEVSVSFH